MRKSFSASAGVSAEVGSSRMSSRRSAVSARAISTNCSSATDRPATSARGSTAMPSWPSASLGARVHRLAVDRAERRERRVAHGDVLGDVEMREELRILIDRGDAGPARLDRRREPDRARRRAASSPASASRMPVMILTSVDLPAPFSPTSACTRPAPMSKETSDSARDGPKDLLIPAMRSKGPASVIRPIEPSAACAPRTGPAGPEQRDPALDTRTHAFPPPCPTLPVSLFLRSSAPIDKEVKPTTFRTTLRDGVPPNCPTARSDRHHLSAKISDQGIATFYPMAGISTLDGRRPSIRHRCAGVPARDCGPARRCG